jgi:alkylation response protein AidB-like acyl-CoA dehydrogenase
MPAPATSTAAGPNASAAAEAAEAAVEAIAGSAGQEVTFSLALSQDQKDIREWVHGFAEDVVRPAAHEWDEREQTPWPIIQEAAKIGLYGFEGMAQFFADPTGLTLPIVNEELFWGDAGIGMSIMGTGLAVAAIFGQGSGEQLGEWIPRCFGTTEEIKVAASRAPRSAPRSRTPARTSRRCARAPNSIRRATSGCSTGRRRGRPTAALPTFTW